MVRWTSTDKRRSCRKQEETKNAKEEEDQEKTEIYNNIMIISKELKKKGTDCT